MFGNVRTWFKITVKSVIKRPLSPLSFDVKWVLLNNENIFDRFLTTPVPVHVFLLKIWFVDVNSFPINAVLDISIFMEKYYVIS